MRQFVLCALAVSCLLMVIARPQNEGLDAAAQQDHMRDGHHDPTFDQNAFLGKDDAETYQHLTEEQSKARLSALVDKIDEDKDGFLSLDELKNQIVRAQNSYLVRDTNQHMTKVDSNKDGLVGWTEFVDVTYGRFEVEDMVADHIKDMIARDKVRFDRADIGSKGHLTKQEFDAFLHPESHDHMKEVVVNETFSDLDKDHNGQVSLEEFIGDLWKPSHDEEVPPEWLETEKIHFRDYRDKNRDGYLDRDEVKDWIIPPDYDTVDAEAQHLLYEADANKDASLSKEEILERYDIFVGSQLTDFGDVLRHEEL